MLRDKKIEKGMTAPSAGVQPLNSTVSLLHEIRGNLIVKGFIEDKPAAFTVDMDATVSTICPDVVDHSSMTWTAAGSFVRLLGKTDSNMHGLPRV